jgi:hypothetical protein
LDWFAEPQELTRKYTARQQISAAKKKDLVGLMQKWYHPIWIPRLLKIIALKQYCRWRWLAETVPICRNTFSNYSINEEKIIKSLFMVCGDIIFESGLLNTDLFCLFHVHVLSLINRWP